MFALNNYSIRKFFFLTSILIYSLFSFPTPKHFSIVELLIIIFFFLSFNINIKIIKEFFIEKTQYIFLISILIIFLTLPSNFENSKQLFRDTASAVFFLFPLFFLYFTETKKNTYLPIILVIGGIVLFYRLLIKYLIYNNTMEFINFDLEYLFNDTLILFSLNFILFYTFLFTKGPIKIILILFSILNWYLIIHFSLSAGSKIYFISLFYNFFILLIYISNQLNKKKNLIKFLKKNYFFHYLFFLILVLSFYFNSYLIEYLNSRDYEIDFFLNHLQKSNDFKLLFGLGLGSYFKVSLGNSEIFLTYLHIFPLYMIIKTGLLTSLIIFIIWNKLFYIYKFRINDLFSFIFLNKTNLIMHSSFIILLSGLTFYTSYKHFSFWLIISILCLEINKKINYENYKSNNN